MEMKAPSTTAQPHPPSGGVLAGDAAADIISLEQQGGSGYVCGQKKSLKLITVTLGRCVKMIRLVFRCECFQYVIHVYSYSEQTMADIVCNKFMTEWSFVGNKYAFFDIYFEIDNGFIFQNKGMPYCIFTKLYDDKCIHYKCFKDKIPLN